MLFKIGTTVATHGALDALEAESALIPNSSPNLLMIGLMSRHIVGDWGDVCEDDAYANDVAITEGTRLLSAYRLVETGVKIWVITEADRSSTCILLPDEY